MRLGIWARHREPLAPSAAECGQPGGNTLNERMALKRGATTKLRNTPAFAAAETPSTKALLIDAGERLFGHHGFDGISLREIAAVAGQANNAVVHYHFKDKPGLIRAILDDRVVRIETIRSELLTTLKTSRNPDPKEMLKILWLPSMSIKGSDGSHTFCRFLLQHILHPDMVPHPIGDVINQPKARKGKAKAELPYLVESMEMLREYYHKIPEEIFSKRLLALSTMFLASVVQFENTHFIKASTATLAFDTDSILNMGLAALSAPP